MSGSRIREAGRFRECAHMGCFDLHTFIEINQRARKWQCPVCMKLYALDSLIIDPFFHRVCEQMAQYDSDVTDIQLRGDGTWRPKLESLHTSSKA
ncbi:unnamed protein product, partial [Closterium sp. NIES-54]